MVLLQDYSKFHVSYPMLFIILLFGSCLLMSKHIKCRENRIKYDNMQ